MKRTPLQRIPDLQGWADRINRHVGSAVASIISVGRELQAAKSALQHGEWGRLFVGHPEAVKKPIQFSARTARALMQIGEHPILSNRKHVTDLPPSWGTLWALARLPQPTLRKALTDGRVHPGMERKEVTALRGLTKPKINQFVPVKPLLVWMGSPVSACFSTIARKLEETVFDLSPEDRDELFGLIRDLLNDLERRVKETP